MPVASIMREDQIWCRETLEAVKKILDFGGRRREVSVSEILDLYIRGFGLAQKFRSARSGFQPPLGRLTENDPINGNIIMLIGEQCQKRTPTTNFDIIAVSAQA
jgi:hypothetical protein